MTTQALPRPLTIQSSLFDRAAAAFGAARVLFRDPNRLDQVLVFMQAVNLGALRRRLRQLDGNAEAERLFRERPRIDERSIDYAALKRLPEGTLGRAYVEFLHANEISPEPFENPPELGDENASYLVMRMRQTHDLWHVVTGYTTDVRGELLLQAFTYAQIRAPGSLLTAVLGSLRHARRIPGHARALWEAYLRGKAANTFATFRWEDHFETPVEEVRRLLACAA